MKTYELIEDGLGGEALKVTFENGSYGFIPTDPANSDYAEYLRYTEWVDAGNNPEEFWTRLEAGDN